MSPEKKYVSLRACLFFLVISAWAPLAGRAQFSLNIRQADKDSAFSWQVLQLQTSFTDQLSCYSYVLGLPKLLGSKGFPTASVDSIEVKETFISIRLFIGRQYKWVRLTPNGIDK